MDPPCNLGGILDAASEGGGDGGLLYHPCSPDGDAWRAPTRQSFLELRDEARRILGGLCAAGCRPGDRLRLPLGRPRDLLPALWAGLLGGLVAVPEPPPPVPSPRLPDPESGATWNIVTGTGAGEQGEGFTLALEALRTGPPAREPEAPDADATALLLATSGSTGAPRWVALRHSNVLASLEGTVALNGFTAAEVSLNWLPLHHVGGLLRSLRDVYLGCTQVQVPSQVVGGDPLTWLDLMAAFGVTTSWAPNFAYGLLVSRLQSHGAGRGPWDLRALRSLNSSGEPVRGRTVLALWEALAPYGLPAAALHSSWGMTEACFSTSSHRLLEEVQADPDRIPSVGRPIPGVRVRILDDEGHPQPEPAVGRLQICGPAVGRYLDAVDGGPAAGPEGWLDTGDLASLAGGVLTVTGRTGGRIRIRGRDHAPVRLEASVEGVEGVTPGSAVVVAAEEEGRDTPDLALFFTPRPGRHQDLGSVVYACREAVGSRHGVSLRFVLPLEAGALPRSPAGKLLRRELLEAWRSGGLAVPGGWPFDLEAPPGAPGTPARDVDSGALADEVAASLARPLGRPQLSPGENFFAAGGDSLQVMEAVGLLRARFPDCHLTPADLYRFPTAESLTARIQGRVPGLPEPAGRREPGSRQRRRERRLRAAGGPAGRDPRGPGERERES